MNELSWHLIKIYTFNALQRVCRPYHESAVDSFEDGRLKYEWDELKEKFFFRNNTAIVDLCNSCYLNISGGYEGCMSRIPNLNLLKQIIHDKLPESVFLKYSYIDDQLDYWSSRELLDEIDNIKNLLNTYKWPVAKVEFLDRTVDENIIYPWDATDDERLIYGNEGYSFGITKEGILIKVSISNILPKKFIKLWKKDEFVYGSTTDEEIIIFERIGDFLPTWISPPELGPSELIFQKINAIKIFDKTLNILTAFLQASVKSATGISISFLE